jgi:hypothetical protein
MAQAFLTKAVVFVVYFKSFDFICQISILAINTISIVLGLNQ